MNNHTDRENWKKKLFANPADSDFEQEATEGWAQIGKENWEQIHHNLDNRIDKIISSSSNKEVSLPSKPAFLKFRYSIAALLLVLIGTSVFIYSIRKQNTPEVLFNAYYKPLSAPESHFRGDEKTQDIPTQSLEASDAYDQLEYKKAIALYSELLKESPNNSKYTLFLGLSYINDGKYNEAIILFNNHKTQNTSYDEDIKWYLALAHLRKGEVKTSSIILKDIASNSNSYYNETAEQLVQKLAQLK